MELPSRVVDTPPATTAQKFFPEPDVAITPMTPVRPFSDSSAPSSPTYGPSSPTRVASGAAASASSASSSSSSSSSSASASTSVTAPSSTTSGVTGERRRSSLSVAQQLMISTNEVEKSHRESAGAEAADSAFQEIFLDMSTEKQVKKRRSTAFHFKGSFIPKNYKMFRTEDKNRFKRKAIWFEHRTSMHFLSLEFQDPNLELLFLEDYSRRSKRPVKVGLLLSTLFCLILALVAWLLTNNLEPVVALAPCLFLCFLLSSWVQFFKRWMQFVVGISLLIGGTAMGVLLLTNSAIPTRSHESLDLLIYLLFVCIFLKLRFFFALILAIYELVFFQILAVAWRGSNLQNAEYVIGAAIFLLIMSYSMEAMQRKDFLLAIAVFKEKERSELLLLNILPKHVADCLKEQNGSRTVAEGFENVTILFADIVSFTTMSARMRPSSLVSMLNRIFTEFDKLAEKYGLEKIKTIGDAYMVAGGVPVSIPGHADRVAYMALGMQEVMSTFRDDRGEPLNIRVGIHTGPCVAGVIGIRKFTYDLWGDAVNTASRMESSGIPGKIQISEATYQLLTKQNFELEHRGVIEVKGKGKMETYLLHSARLPPPDHWTMTIFDRQSQRQQRQFLNLDAIAEQEPFSPHANTLADPNSI